MGDAVVGLQARLMSQALRKLTGGHFQIQDRDDLHQPAREKIGIMFGNPETTPGGRAFKFYSSVRLDVRAAEKIKEGDRIIGTRVKVKVVKNKVAPPFREASFVLIHGVGVLREADIIDQGVNLNIITKSGSWFNYGSEKLGQGFDGAIKYLKGESEGRGQDRSGGQKGHRGAHTSNSITLKGGRT